MELNNYMKSTKKLLLEVRKLNETLDRLSHNSRFMIYSANPFKFAWFNFLAGAFHSLGSLFGTAVIAAAFVYFFSQIDFIPSITGWIESILSQVRWEQIVPTPSL